MSVQSQYLHWLTLTAGEEGLQRELLEIKDDPAAVRDRFYTDLAFGTAGMRGVLGAGANRMNVLTVRRAAAGLAQYLLEDEGSAGPVVIAYDSRRFSDRFALETALTLAARGVPALLFDALRPVPVLSFAVRFLGAAAGVAITASHNPPEYNGFKAYGPDGAQLSPDAARGVTRHIQALRYEDCAPLPRAEALEKGLLKIIGKAEVDDAYTAMVLGLMVRPEAARRHGKDLHIVYTPLHGAGNVPVRRVLREAGFTSLTVVPEQELPDPDFPTVPAPNPENPAAFTLAIPLAKKSGATVILGTDPDCDRLGVCVRDAGGEYRTLTGNQIGCLLMHHILSERKKQRTLPENGACVKSIVSTELARAISRDFGAEQFDVLTGFKYVGELIQRFEETGSHTFLFGFEESFGYLSGTKVRDKDAVNAALLVAEAACLCALEGRTLYDRLQEIYETYGHYVESVVSEDYPGQEGARHIQRLMAALRAQPPRQIGGLKVLAARDYQSGLRTQGGHSAPMGLPPSDVLYFELEGNGWVCVRPSGTEPKIKLYTGVCCRDGGTAAVRMSDELTQAARALLRAGA